MAAPVYQTAVSGSLSAVTSWTANLPGGGASVGDLIILITNFYNSSSLTNVPAGFQSVYTITTGSTNRLSVFTKIYAGEANFPCSVATGGAPGGTWMVFRISGVDTISPTDVNVTGAWQEEGHALCPSLTIDTTHVNELLFYIVAATNYYANCGWYQYNPFIPFDQGTSTDGQLFFVGSPSTSSGSYNIQAQSTQSVACYAIMFAIRGTDAGGAEISNFYTEVAYTNYGAYRVTQQALEVSVLNTSAAYITQQSVEILRSYSNASFHTTDTCLEYVYTKTHTTGILTWIPKWHTADIVTANIYTKFHTTDIWVCIPKPHTTDTVTASLRTHTHATYADLRGEVTYSHTADIRCETFHQISHEADTVMMAWVTNQHTADADLKGPITKQYDTDIHTYSVAFWTHTTDTWAHSPKWHTTDYLLFVVNTKTHNTDVSSIWVPLLDHITDTFILNIGHPHHTTDISQRGTEYQSHSTDISQRGTEYQSHSTDITPLNFQQSYHTTDMVSMALLRLEHSTDITMMQPAAPPPPIPHKFTYIDDYGTIYTTMWRESGFEPLTSLDITTIVEQPYVWGQPATGSNSNMQVYRQGIITIQRMILNSIQGGGYVIQSEGHNQYIGDVLTSFSCDQPTINPFAYLLNNAVTEEAICRIDVGPCYVDPDDTFNVVWPDVNPDGSIAPAGTGETLLEWDDVWNNE